MPRFLVTAELLISSTQELELEGRLVKDHSKREYIYENYEIIAEDKKQAQEFAYKEYYFKHCYNGAEVIDNPSRIWIDAETIQLHSGKGAGKGGTRKGSGRKKGSGSKYSEPTKSMKVPTRFDGKMSELVQMADDLRAFINNWDEGLQPLPDGHYSERKKLARKMLDDLKSMCEVLNETAPIEED
jgi:hypothetical protein